ncbi:hypothetical protein QYE76_043191 [Lolium multiflorum]|uniref:CCHC-type domain-containing protein n=1 Tax=Lolium multiflorum TaxID=4521 RepID=A0AAD8TIK8_LOLMU|nr:hypothetical protein QYE76_043191 [Lolium multiflorum]
MAGASGLGIARGTAKAPCLAVSFQGVGASRRYPGRYHGRSLRPQPALASFSWSHSSPGPPRSPPRRTTPALALHATLARSAACASPASLLASARPAALAPALFPRTCSRPQETKDSIGQDKILKGASTLLISHGPHICLMAKGSTVPPTMEPNMSRGDKDEDEYEEEDWIVSLRDKGHHVRSCPLKKKQKRKRPQAQTHIQPQVEEMPLPKKKQANAPIVEKPSEKKEKKRTCYICREKGHISSLCTIGTTTIDDVYSLRKDEGGNVFAKFVGAQSGVKKRTIWVAKPIVTNLLGPNLVGDQQSKT